MSQFSKVSFLFKILTYAPLILLMISVFNEFDFNYLEIEYFSFNFPFILIFYWSLKKSESLGYGFIFLAGLINDVVIGFPIGISSLSYLLICSFAAYLRNITLRPSLVKDWVFFVFTILVVSSFIYSILVFFFSYKINYVELILNIFFTSLLYVFFAYIFQFYQRLVFGKEYV
mgnify:CR=1 FL=1